jgi:hypothetical protein
VESRTKAILVVTHLAVAVAFFIAGREHLRAEIREGLRGAFKPLAELAGTARDRPSADVPIPKPVTIPTWQISEEKSPMDDTAAVTLSLEAKQGIRAWPGELHTPTLIIRCREKRTSVYVVNGASPNIEHGVDGATVRLRLDSMPAFSQEWAKSTDGEALFAPNPIALAKGLAHTSTLLYEFTPFNSSPQQTTFELKGIANHLSKVSGACDWKPQ